MRTRLLAPLLALPLLVLAGCGGSSGDGSGGTSGAGKAAGDTGTASGPPTAQTFTVTGTDQLTFKPSTVNAKVGTLTLTLKNGGVPHDLKFDDNALPSIPTVSGDRTASAKLTFDKPGTYTFVCTIHPGMQGKVVVQR